VRLEVNKQAGSKRLGKRHQAALTKAMHAHTNMHAPFPSCIKGTLGARSKNCIASFCLFTKLVPPQGCRNVLGSYNGMNVPACKVSPVHTLIMTQ